MATTAPTPASGAGPAGCERSPAQSATSPRTPITLIAGRQQRQGRPNRENTEAVRDSTDVLCVGWVGGLAGVGWRAMKTDHGFYGLFQSAPDLITLLLPQGSSAAPLLGRSGPEAARSATQDQPVAVQQLLAFVDGVVWLNTPERPRKRGDAQ